MLKVSDYLFFKVIPLQGNFELTVSLFYRWNRAKMSKAQRDDRVKQKKAHFMKNLEADDD